MWKWNDQHVMNVGHGFIGSNPVGDSDFFFVPFLWHADHFIFSFVSLSLKFAIFHSVKNLDVYCFKNYHISLNNSWGRLFKGGDYLKYSLLEVVPSIFCLINPIK